MRGMNAKVIGLQFYSISLASILTHRLLHSKTDMYMKFLSIFRKAFSFTLLALLVHTANAQDKLPSVLLEKPGGQKINILDVVKNKELTVIDFWATWCIPCLRELDNIADIYPDWQDEWDMQLIAVSIDDQKTKAQVLPVFNGKGYEYELLLDPNKDFFYKMNGITPPLTIVVDRKGNILNIHHSYIEGDEYELEEFIANWFGN